MSKAKEVVKAVLKDLEGRSGFDHWWDDIDASIQREIKSELIAIVESILDEQAAESESS